MYIVSFKTLTAAQRAGSVLRAGGITHSIVGVDPDLTKRGCSYGLSFEERDRNEVMRLFGRHNIVYGAVFRK